MHTFIHSYINAYLHGCIHTNKQTYIHYIHSFMHTYVQAYMHTYIHFRRDLAGQDRFQGLARIYYRDAVGAFVVFDMFNPKSFESAKKWKQDIDSKVFLADGAKIPVVLLGNKVCFRPEDFMST